MAENAAPFLPQRKANIQLYGKSIVEMERDCTNDCYLCFNGMHVN